MKKGVILLLGFVIIAVYLVSAGIGNAFSQDISRDPTEFAPYGKPLGRTSPATVNVTLFAHERTGTIDAGSDEVVGTADDITYNAMTFGSSSDPETGRIPGPFIRVLEGDTINVTLNNSLGNETHSIDFHAIKGYKGGMTKLTADAGDTVTATFKLLHPGLYVYHCAADGVIANIATHIANGMWGMILVEPQKGGKYFRGDVKKADKEFYIMQCEFYLDGDPGLTSTYTPGNYAFDLLGKGLAEHPDYVVFNGRAGVSRATIASSAPPVSIDVNLGDNVIIYFGNMGPSLISGTHMIGEIWDREYEEGDVLSPPRNNIETSTVPPASTVIWAFKPLVKESEGGANVLVDHAIFRVAKGAFGLMHVLP
ncbi:MAG: hypothetical protein A2069_03525 [Planctomycetes bacterium GWB2_41_19]|nr:MAG: hypothetical protein A2069_03525 [Planctomycetes bacterium GWB2_41_19]